MRKLSVGHTAGYSILAVLAFAHFFFLVAGCDSTNPGFEFPRDIEDTYNDFPRGDSTAFHIHTGPNLLTFDDVAFESGNYRFNIRPDGVLYEGEWNDHPENPDSTVGTLFSGGLWMTGNQKGTMRANVTWIGGWRSNFEPAKLPGEDHSIYFFRDVDVGEDAGNWPASLGAPVLDNYLPAIFGHLVSMAPTITGSIPERDRYASGFDSVQVVQTVFAFDRPGVADMFFVRYDITNRSGQDLDPLRLSIITDTDLDYGGRGSRTSTCDGVVTYSWNRTGFDLNRRLSYTYSQPDGVSVDDPCIGVVTGYLILETRLDDGSLVWPDNHRIYRRNTGREWYFSESTMDNVEDLLLAAEGLSTRGEPMINPATGAATKWAFTGNPIDGTGWIDYPNDVRSLLSTEAFILRPGEHAEMTAAWITTRRPTLELALGELRRQADILITYPSIWRDPREAGI